MKETIAILTLACTFMGMLILDISYTETRANEENEIIIEYSIEEETTEEITEDEDFSEDEVFFDSDYDYYCWLVGYAAERNGIDPKLAVAISRLETGNFTSKAFLNGHNFGGLTGKNGVYEFKRETEGLEAYMNCLKWYRDNGMDTVDKMAKVYCPDNDEWGNLIKALIKEGE